MTVRPLAATLLALVAWAAGPAAAGPPMSVPPEAVASGAVATAAQALRRDIDRLSATPPGMSRDAGLALRRVAFDLLARGNDAPDDAQAMAVAGLRLAKACAPLDAMLAAAEAERRVTPSAAAALARFARAAEHGLEASPPQSEPERALRELLAPLREAVASLESRPPSVPATAWPTEQDLATPSLAAAPGAARTAPADGAAPAGAGRALAPEDEARIAAMKPWPDAIGAMNAVSRDRFAGITKQWAANLRSPQQRDAARATIDRFARELETFRSVPLERALRSNDPAAAEAALGRGPDALRAIDRHRLRWVKAWSDGRGSAEATGAMLRLARVLAALEASSALSARLAAARGLDRWGGWSCAVTDLGIHPKAISGRGALALEAVLSDDATTADAQLARLDAELPLAWFAALLAERVTPWASTRPALGSILAAAADGPAEGAWLGDRRAEWALVGRLAAEEAHARSAGNAPLAEALRAELGARASALVPLVHRDGAAVSRMADVARSIGAR